MGSYVMILASFDELSLLDELYIFQLYWCHGLNILMYYEDQDFPDKIGSYENFLSYVV